MRQLVLGSMVAFFWVVVVTATARADIGFPGLRNVLPTYRIVTNEELPDSAFVIRRFGYSYVRDEGNGKETRRDVDEAEYAELAPDHPIVVPTARQGIHLVVLLIVPRSAVASYKSALELAQAVDAHQVANTIRHEFPRREAVPEWHGDEMSIVYRVQRAASDGNQLEIVRTTWNQAYQCCVVGLLLPLAVILGGLWLIRKRQRRKTYPPGGRT